MVRIQVVISDDTGIACSITVCAPSPISEHL